MGKLDGKVAVITGAASGMGRATALRFTKEGAAVVLTDLNATGGEDAVAECAAAGGKAVFQRTDVTSEADIKAAVDRAVREYGKLDIMFNNAGVAGAIGPIEKVTSQDWDRTFAILLRAVFLGMKYSIPELRKAGGGSIITTSSVAGLRGSGYLATYSAAKGAIITLTQAVAIELGHDKIRVNCICPGGVNTPLIHRGRPGAEEGAEKNMARMQPIPRAGRPDDIANMALFLASDDAEWITGTAMVVDGGMNTGNARFRLAGLPDAGFSGPSFEHSGDRSGER
ncbi:MAG TPA: SDR family oxidoreductase [Candidatus Binataceae bacterium]|nr:SDR family oxidoreductase [Candidatus Binataceae bacterium]